MPNNRGRMGSGSGSSFGGYSGYSTGTTGGYGRTAAGRTTSKRRTSGSTAGGATAYRTVGSTFQNKINSFKTLYSQTQGPAKHGRPSPTTLNSFANWINKGAIVQTVSSAQVARWAKQANKNFNSRKPSLTACKNVLCGKFGKGAIKAVAMTKSGSFMVATPPTHKGRSFNFPR